MRRGRIVVQKFSPCVSDGSSKAVFERADAFYIPVVRFNSALRPGLELTVYHVVNSYHRNRQIRVFWTSKRAMVLGKTDSWALTLSNCSATVTGTSLTLKNTSGAATKWFRDASEILLSVHFLLRRNVSNYGSSSTH